MTGGDGQRSPLRDVQLISRAQLAPFFAVVNILAALMMISNLWDHVGPTWLVPWLGAVAVVNLGAMQLARHQSITCVGRSGRRVPMWMLVGDVAMRAVVWLSLPLYLFPHMEPATQVIAASVMAGLGIAALGLVVIPPCVTAWMVRSPPESADRSSSGDIRSRSSTCSRSCSRSESQASARLPLP